MFRTFMAKFTPTHFVALALGAMFAPTVVYGVAAYQNVSIEDVTTGAHVQVDALQRLQVVESASVPVRNPYNYFKLPSASCYSTNNNPTIYTVPSGKILVVKHVALSFYGATSGNDNYIYLIDNDSGGGVVTTLESPNTAGSQAAELEHYVRSSIRLGCSSASGVYIAALDGFLIPATSLPAPSVAQANGQQIVGAPLIKDGRRL